MCCPQDDPHCYLDPAAFHDTHTHTHARTRTHTHTHIRTRARTHTQMIPMAILILVPFDLTNNDLSCCLACLCVLCIRVASSPERGKCVGAVLAVDIAARTYSSSSGLLGDLGSDCAGKQMYWNYRVMAAVEPTYPGIVDESTNIWGSRSEERRKEIRILKLYLQTHAFAWICGCFCAGDFLCE